MRSKHITALSDEQVALRVREDDQEFYAEIVSRYQRRLLRYITYLIGDEELAQDVAQNVFVKAFVNLNSFDTNRSFQSWIYRIAHNEAINASKKKFRRRLVEKGIDLLERLPSGEDIEESYTEELTQKDVRALIEYLPEMYRAPLTLHYFDDLSYKEISSILRIPIGTVGTRITRGKKKLYKLYQVHHERKS